ncbi:hypothetical protein IMZ48_32080 [Candidatus Bathyarchaeota archaeon]|nr:hypothetical protein [Candidatus Bathyarchaeota archaeon]
MAGSRRNSTRSRTSSSSRCVSVVAAAPPRRCPPLSRKQLEANQTQQRNLNNAFAYDLVPSASVIVAALNAARRVNDFATAVRVFEGTESPLSFPNCQIAASRERRHLANS